MYSTINNTPNIIPTLKPEPSESRERAEFIADVNRKIDVLLNSGRLTVQIYEAISGLLMMLRAARHCCGSNKNDGGNVGSR